MYFSRWMQQSGIYVFVLLLSVFFGYWYYINNRDVFELKCILSTVDGNKYCVRDTTRKQETANLLAEATDRMSQLVDHLQKKYPDRPEVKRLAKGFNPDKISETLPSHEHVAFSENKSKMSFCVTEKKGGAKLIDMNTLMFVALHEMAHIASESVGHKQEFWDNFRFLLVEAESIGIYTPENYKESPKEFCSMKITDNPYFDGYDKNQSKYGKFSDD